MLPAIICGLLFATMGLIATQHSFSGSFIPIIKYPLLVFMFVLFALTGFGFGAIGSSLFIAPHLSTEWSLQESETLLTLQDGIEAGRFFLGIGVVEGTRYYFFARGEKGKYHLTKVPMGEVKVSEVDQREGIVEFWTPRLSNPSYRWLTFEQVVRRCKLLIPKGSITLGFVPPNQAI